MDRKSMMGGVMSLWFSESMMANQRASYFIQDPHGRRFLYPGNMVVYDVSGGRVIRHTHGSLPGVPKMADDQVEVLHNCRVDGRGTVNFQFSDGPVAEATVEWEINCRVPPQDRARVRAAWEQWTSEAPSDPLRLPAPDVVFPSGGPQDERESSADRPSALLRNPLLVSISLRPGEILDFNTTASAVWHEASSKRLAKATRGFTANKLPMVITAFGHSDRLSVEAGGVRLEYSRADIARAADFRGLMDPNKAVQDASVINGPAEPISGFARPLHIDLRWKSNEIAAVGAALDVLEGAPKPEDGGAAVHWFLLRGYPVRLMRDWKVDTYILHNPGVLLHYDRRTFVEAVRALAADSRGSG